MIRMTIQLPNGTRFTNVSVTPFGDELYRLEEDAFLFSGAKNVIELSSMPLSGDIVRMAVIGNKTVLYESIYQQRSKKRFEFSCPKEFYNSSKFKAVLETVVRENGYWERDKYGDFLILLPDTSSFDPKVDLKGDVNFAINYYVRTQEQYDETPELRRYPHCVNMPSFTAAGVIKFGQRFALGLPGEMGPYLSCPDHIILRNDVVKWLMEFGCSGIDPKPVTIFQKDTGETWDNYFDLCPLEEITKDTIESFKDATGRAWHLAGGLLFVSNDISFELQKIERWAFFCTPGFTDIY